MYVQPIARTLGHRVLNGEARVFFERSKTMKTIVRAFVALALLAGAAGGVNALDPKTFYENLDKAAP